MHLENLGVNIPSTNAYQFIIRLLFMKMRLLIWKVFRAVAKDSTNTEYQIFFTIHDTADPYDIKNN